MKKQIPFPLLGALVIAIVVLAAYQPALGLEFSPDDFMWLNWGGRLPLSQYFFHTMDTADFRPLQAAQWKIAYQLWGDNFSAYHFLNVLFHLSAALLLFRLVGRISKHWGMAFVAALIYSTLTVSNFYDFNRALNLEPTLFLIKTQYSITVFAPGVPDPLEAVFFILAIGFWLTYLQQRDKLHYVSTLAATLSALFTKELGVVLFGVLFLADRLLVAEPARLDTLWRRYLPFALLLLVYIPLVYFVHSTSPYTRAQYNFDNPWFSHLLEYLQAIVFPWGSNGSATQLWLIAVAVLCSYVALVKQNRRVTFLALGALLTVLPVTPFYFILPRYLYLPLMSACVAIAALTWQALQIMRAFKWSGAVASGAVALLVWGGGLNIAHEAGDFSQVFRERILPFMPVVEQHPGFPPGTLLYFIDPPMYSLQIAGLFLPYYSRSVAVNSTDSATRAGLHDYRNAYVFFFDDQGSVHEQKVGGASVTLARPALPADLDAQIQLEGYELSNNVVRRGDAVIVLLYWKAVGVMDKNYTMFAHLIDSEGKIVEGYDSEPQAGRVPTTLWGLGQLIVSSAVITVPPDTPVGDGYRLEVGVYYQPTMQRLPIVDVHGQPVTDKIVIEPLRIVE